MRGALACVRFCSAVICHHIIHQIFCCLSQFSIWVSVLSDALHTESDDGATHWLQAIFNLLLFHITHSPYEPPSRLTREQTAHFPCLDSSFSHTQTILITDINLGVVTMGGQCVLGPCLCYLLHPVCGCSLFFFFLYASSLFNQRQRLSERSGQWLLTQQPTC